MKNVRRRGGGVGKGVGSGGGGSQRGEAKSRDICAHQWEACGEACTPYWEVALVFKGEEEGGNHLPNHQESYPTDYVLSSMKIIISI